MSDDSGSTLDPDKIPRRRGLHIRDIKEEAPEPEQTVGNELRAAREAAGKELNEVAAALRIKPEHLSALEAAEYDKLPAKTYVVGFVRQYAQQLGLDANELVERLKVELEGPPPEEEAPAHGKPEAMGRRAVPAGAGGIASTRPGPSVERGARLPVTSIAIIVILLVVVIFGGWYLTRPSGDNNATADKEPETGSTSAPAVPRENRDGGQGGEESGQRMPDPPVIPASAGNGTGAERGGGSLAALLPGTDHLAEGAAETPARLNLPDAAAMAVPVENTGGAAAAGGEPAGSQAGTGSRRGDLETAMPQPNLELQTARADRPGIPRESAGEAEDAGAEEEEPALEEIEAEGVGGAAHTEEASSEARESRPEPEQASADEPAAEAPAAGTAAPANSRVTLRVRSSTWVRVEDADGTVIMERDMRSGESFQAPDKKGLYLVTKDAGAIELLLDGESIGLAGRPRQVLTGLKLAPAQLKRRVAQNATGRGLR